MTTNDEDRLRFLLGQAGDAISPPPGATSHILEAAAIPRPPADSSDDATTSQPVERTGHFVAGRRVAWHRRMPSTKVAASVVALAAIALSVASFEHGASAPSRLSAHVAKGVAAPPAVGSTEWRDEQAANIDSNAVAAAAATNGAPVFAGPSDKTAVQRSAASVDETRIVATGVIALTLRDGSVHHAVQALGSMAERDGGYVASSNAHLTGSNASVATVVLRVPELKFQALVAAVQHLGHVASVVTSSSNVTGQYVDYVARIKALEDSRTQYLAILARATTISDILAVQAQVNNLQSQIEQLEGQRNLLVNEAAYSTLSVAINQNASTTNLSESGLRHSVHESIAGFVAGFEWLVRAIGPALFALLCLLALWFVSRTGWRTARRRML